MQTHFFNGREERYEPPPDKKLNPPEEVAAAVVLAPGRPAGAGLRELVITASEEPNWP